MRDVPSMLIIGPGTVSTTGVLHLISKGCRRCVEIGRMGHTYQRRPYQRSTVTPQVDNDQGVSEEFARTKEIAR